MRARIASRCGPTRGASQTRLTSRWAILPPRARTRCGGMLQEDRGRRAAPFLLRGREMGADVAVAERAIDRVAQGVQHHVGVGMALELAVVRDPHAAEPHRVAFREGVDVETLADAHVGQRRRKPLGGGVEIAHRRHLEIGRLALEHMHRMARRFGDGGVVGHIGARRGAMRGEDQSKRKACGVCTARKPRPVGRADDAVAVDLLDRVGDGGRGDRRAVALRRRRWRGRPARARRRAARRRGSARCRARTAPAPPGRCAR